MAKLILKIAFIASILVAASLYTNYLFTGKSPSFIQRHSELADLDFSNLKDSAASVFKKGESKSSSKYMYKWRDAQNVIHYVTEKPTDNISFETIELNSNVNVVPAVTDSNANNQKTQPSNPPPTEPVTNVYSPEGIEQLFNQAKDIQNQVNDAFQQQEKLTH